MKILLKIAVITYGILVTASYSQLPSPSNAVSVRFDFETGVLGWTNLNQAYSKGCVHVSRSDAQAKVGAYSLKCDMDLDGSAETTAKGEAYVDLTKSAPQGLTAPININGRTIMLSVFASAGSAGDSAHPKGLQVFVKDANGKCFYGRRVNIREGAWNDVSLPVSSAGTQDGYLEEGFNPAGIVVLGIKMSTGTGSTAKFHGSVFVDKITW